jgi:hypothetical protein
MRAGRLSGHWQKGRVGVMCGVVGICERAGVWDGKGRKKGEGRRIFCLALLFVDLFLFCFQVENIWRK